jgi:hypothetical protein
MKQLMTMKKKSFNLASAPTGSNATRGRKNNMKTFLLSTIAGALVLSACGGGGGQQTAGIDGGGAPAPAPAPVVIVVSIGTITGIGSVIVNGVTYDTGSAAFTIDGNSGSQTDLAVGQVIVVRGTLNNNQTTGVAETVTYDDAVEGPVSSIDSVANTLTVLGQLVRVDVDTSFGDGITPASLEGISVTDLIEVSGFHLADGSISATRIEWKPGSQEMEITGIVSNAGATTFEINGFVVDYSSAMLDGFPGGAPEDDQLVEAKGMTLGGAGQLLATIVEFEDGSLGDDGDKVELEGFITRFDAGTPTDFDVAGNPVMTNGQTVFENGTIADLALNRKVEVEGDVNAAGVLVAVKVEIKTSGFIRAESLVESVQGTQLTVLGIVINVNEATRFEDKSVADLESFGIGDINVDDYVVIRGYEDSTGVVATLLEREDFDGEVSLRGFVFSVNDPEFTILGTTVTTGATVFRDIDESPIPAGTFFAQANGRLVEAKGTLNGSSISATEVSFEK